ncbi:dienelactone hydrolase [Podospora didyma]|uniref:Dienelactone hydrolase n=1 Tax=Podospora didyma TaxID=330526 RepID=A0AAE0N094_9PEZI|nr:dienelactone hydrolase [Podospora didyma]
MADSDYLAKPPSACCFSGTIHRGTPRGRVEQVLDIPTYIARPAEGKGNGHVVLYFPDVWGHSNNAFLLMDAFADAGFLTLGIDYFRGNDPLPEGFDQAAWRAKHVAFATENVPKWAAAARERFGSTTPEKTKYAVVGYCFGAPYVMQMLAATDNHVSAGAFAHPTLLKEEDFVGIKHPLLLSCAENDHAFNTESRRKAIDILQRENKVYHEQLFYGIAHGFASKGDPDDPYQRWCKEQSLRAIIDWFDLWLIRS